MRWRARIAGAVLALALVGALSAGVASGLERARGRSRKSPEPRPPFSQQGGVVARASVDPEGASREVARVARMVEARRRPEVSTVTAVARETGARHPAREALPRAPSRSHEEEARTSSDEPAPPGGAVGVPRWLTSRMPAPMRVDWREVVSVDGGLSLVAEVERRGGFDVDIEVRIELPEGARVVEGSTDLVLSRSAGALARVTPCVVAVPPGVVPERDLVLSARARGGSFGAHAEARYTFGRGRQLERQPTPTGPVLPARFLSGSGSESDADDAP